MQVQIAVGIVFPAYLGTQTANPWTIPESAASDSASVTHGWPTVRVEQSSSMICARVVIVAVATATDVPVAQPE